MNVRKALDGVYGSWEKVGDWETNKVGDGKFVS